MNRDIERDIDVDVDHGWGWGWGGTWAGYAAGTAVGVATGAAIAGAYNEPEVVVVQQSPPVNTYVSNLPAGCTTVSSGTSVVFQCGNTYLQPYWDGTSVVYKAVPKP